MVTTTSRDGPIRDVPDSLRATQPSAEPTQAGHPAQPPPEEEEEQEQERSQVARAAHRVRRRRFLAALVVVAVVAFGAGLLGGWIGDSVRERSTTETTTGPTATTRGSSASSVRTMDVAAAINAVEPAVVSVGTTYTVRQGPLDGVVEGAGTGIVLTADGEILTNAHVVASATTITVTVPDSGQTFTARVLGTDTSADIALLKVEGASSLATAPLGDSTTLQVGDDVIAIGNALALEGGLTVTRGIVSALNRSIHTENGTLTAMIQTDTAISSGNSGGPLVDASGQVVGMNTAIATSSSTNTAENIGFAIPINTALNVVKQLRANQQH